MSDPSPPEPKRKQVGVEPRNLPERRQELGTPFEQLNETPEVDAAEAERGIIQPRSLPTHEEATILEAARLLQEGKTHAEVAQQLKIEPMKLRRWENAYSAQFQRDLNEGDYHDTDAQLREIPEDSKEKFQGNWEQVTEKSTERRVKVGPFKANLMGRPVTRWIFRNEHGDIDYATALGILVALAVLGVTLRHLTGDRPKPVSSADVLAPSVNLDDLTSVAHDPKKAGKVIVAFHRTAKWEGKLAYVSHPEKVRPLMEAWYAKHPEDIYIDSLHFKMDTPIDVDGRNFIQVGLEVGTGDTPRPVGRNYFIMAVERMADGDYKIDWETSSGYQPMTYDELIEKKPTEPIELRLTIEVSDYYNFGFNRDEHVAFKGRYLNSEGALYIYGRQDDDRVQSLATKLKFDTDMGVIVKVRYPEDPPTTDQMELVEVIAENWFRNYDS